MSIFNENLQTDKIIMKHLSCILVSAQVDIVVSLQNTSAAIECLGVSFQDSQCCAS